MATPLPGTASAANAIQRIHYTHDSIIDVILAEPSITGAELGRRFGYTGPWISRIINSDAFQARLAERKTDIVDPQLIQKFEDRVKGLALTSLEIVQKRLDNVHQNPVPTPADAEFAHKTLELTTKALGMGARDRGPQVQNNFVVALPPKEVDSQKWVESARAALLPPQPVTDVTLKA